MRSRVTDRAKNHLILLAMLVLLGLTGVVAVVRSRPCSASTCKGGLEVVLKAVPNDPKNPPTHGSDQPGDLDHPLARRQARRE